MVDQMSDATPFRVFIIAGEPSGDALGGALLQGLHTEANFENRRLEIAGVGGPLMEEQGLSSLFPMSDLSVMGLVEILPRLPKILTRLNQTVRAAQDFAPDVLITLDSPDFCLRVARRLRKQMPHLKTAHYVAPSVWAWRPERAQKMAAHIDHVLALLPFEPPLMEAAGMSCDFVGHPAVVHGQPSQIELEQLCFELGVRPAEECLIALLPGSRRGEIARHMPIYREVAARVVAQRPDARFVIPVAGAVSAEVWNATRDWDVRPVLLDPTGLPAGEAEARKRAVLTMCRAALATSGTVSLELAWAECPMVVAYTASRATERMVKKMALIDTANLVNITTETRHVPEFLFDRCTADQITPALLSVLQDSEARDAQIEAARQTMMALGKGGAAPGARAARSVMAFVNRDAAP